MRLGGLFLLTACLSGCSGTEAWDGPGPRHGERYAGVGIYWAGELWQRMVTAARPADGSAATLRDDETVIVVVDSRTGEIRQCGNLTGYCIRMNPWSGPLGREQALPVNLTEHRADLDRARDETGADAASNAAEVRPHPAR